MQLHFNCLLLTWLILLTWLTLFWLWENSVKLESNKKVELKYTDVIQMQTT